MEQRGVEVDEEIHDYLLEAVKSENVNREKDMSQFAKTLLVGDEATETAKFAEMFNKFFDCLNTSNFTVGKQQRNVFKNPYYSAEDFRLTVGPHMHTININYAIFS